MTDAATVSLRRDLRILGLVGTGHFLSHFYLISLPPLFLFLKADFGVSYAALGLIMTFFVGANGVSQVPVGFLVDRAGARIVLVGGLLLEASAIGLVAVAPSFGWVLLLAVLAGLGHSVFHPANYAILSSSVNEERIGRAFSLHTFAGSLGTAVAPMTVVFLASLWDWRVALLAVAAVGIVVAMALLTNRSVLKDDAAPGKRAEGNRASPSVMAGLRLLSSVPMVMFFLFFVTTSLVQSGIHSFSVVAIVAMYDAPLAAASAALTGYLFAVAAGILAGGALADRTTRHDLVAAGAFAVIAAAVALVGAVPMAMAGIVALFSLAGLCQGMVMPARDMMVRAVVPPGDSGKAFGFMAAGGSVGGVITPPLFGWIIDQGEPHWIFWMMAAFMILAMVILLPTRRRAA